MEYILLGGALAFNILVILWKLRHNRIADGVADFMILAVVAAIFGGSTATLIIGTIGSTVVSLYLLASPIRIPSGNFRRT